MRRDLERRLFGAETRRCGSPRVAAILRWLNAAVSAEELGEVLETLSDIDLDLLVDEFERKMAAASEEGGR